MVVHKKLLSFSFLSSLAKVVFKIINDFANFQAEVLYGLIEEYADLKGDGSEIVLDLFCGTGTIGLTLARK